eukprot:GILJ01003841.1.p1 GENE.GILJ01003841.1~~GILJ01003841.1.p1  ORF type:complete len:494 (-),score=72.91 GILJ01003841.1:162-1643(-)
MSEYRRLPSPTEAQAIKFSATAADSPLIAHGKQPTPKSKLPQPIMIARDTDDEDDDLALLDSEVRASVKSSVFNLVSTILGGGVLALPSAFSNSGMLLGVFLVLTMAIVTAYSIHLLVLSARRMEAKSYEELSVRTFGPNGASVVAVLLLFLLFMASIAYVMLMEENISPVLKYLFDWTEYPLGNGFKAIVMAVCVLTVFPVTMLRSMTSLRFTSAISLVAVTFLALAIVIRAVQHMVGDDTWIPVVQPEAADAGSWSWIYLHQGTLNSVSVMSVSFLCHFNVLPVHNDLKNNGTTSRRPFNARMKLVNYSTIFLVSILYIIVAVFGYATFGTTTAANVLENYMPRDPLLTIGRLGLFAVLWLSYPLLVFPLRGVIDRMLRNNGFTVGLAEDGETASTLRYFMVIFFINLVALLLATAVPNVKLVWQFMGSSVTLIIAYILPSAFYLKSSRGVSSTRRRTLALVLLIGASILSVFCTATSIMSVVESYSGHDI